MNALLTPLIADAHGAAADMKARFPGRHADTESDLKGAGAAVGQKIDQVVCHPVYYQTCDNLDH